MKFKIKRTCSQVAQPEPPLKSCSGIQLRIPGDTIEFQKQVYQAIQSYIRDGEEWAVHLLRQVNLC